MIIKIKSIVPNYFTPASSEVWSKDFELNTKSKYLVKAVSGSGKSSFFNFLYGLNNKYSGSILFDDKPIEAFKDENWTNIRREKIAIVFQGLRLFPELTALENIQLKNKLTDYKTEAEIFDYMKRFEVYDLAHRKSETLSYGQQQRMAIIRAFCQPFEFLLLDEPFSHIDDIQIESATALINEEIQQRDASVVIASLGNTYNVNYTKTFLL